MAERRGWEAWKSNGLGVKSAQVEGTNWDGTGVRNPGNGT